MRIMNPFVHLVARMPARVQSKLLAAFLAIVMLLIIVGAVGLQVLSGVNERTEELIKLQRKIEAYRQVQHSLPMTSRCQARCASSTSSDTMLIAWNSWPGTRSS